MMTETAYTKEQMDEAFVRQSDLSDQVRDAMGTKGVRKEVEEIVEDYLKKSWFRILGIAAVTVLSISKFIDMVIHLSGW